MLNVAVIGNDAESLSQKLKSSYLPVKISILDKSLHGAELLKSLKQNHIHLVMLSGYTKKITKNVLYDYPKRILNMHHSMLPKFGGLGMYGINVHRSVLSAGEKITGTTIHLINSEEYDKGPILLQQSIPISTNDTEETLHQKAKVVGEEMYVKILRDFILGRLNLDSAT